MPVISLIGAIMMYKLKKERFLSVCNSASRSVIHITDLFRLEQCRDDFDGNGRGIYSIIYHPIWIEL